MGYTAQEHREPAAGDFSNRGEEFLALLEGHHTTVYAVALARLRDRDSAEDLAQEVFLRAFVQFERGRLPQSVLPWLVCVTRNLATDWHRREQRVSRLNQLVGGQSENSMCSVVSASTPSPRDRIMKQQETEALDAALSALTDDQREVVLLHYMEGRSRREISDQLGVHPSTVGRQLDSALLRLRSALEPGLRQHLSNQRLRPLASGRTAAAVVTLAGISATARARLLTSAAWQEGAAAAVNGSGNSLITAVSAGTKGVMAVAKGKTMAAAAAGVIALIGIGAVGVHYGQNRGTSPMPSNPIPGVTPKANVSAVPLPPLPSGWILSAKPAPPGTPTQMSSRAGMCEWRGMDLNNALNCWNLPTKIVDPAVACKTERFDVSLRAPAGIPQEAFNLVLQTELQRLFGFRATVEKHKVPCLVLTSPAGIPSGFRTAGKDNSVTGGRTEWQFRGQTISSLATNVAGNRNMPVYDETGISGSFDFEMPMSILNPESSWSDQALEDLGLTVTHEERDAEVLFVTPAK